MSDNRPWVLVGPWYRWQRPGVAADGRASRPVFQKYDTAKLVDEFLKDPQRSLKFVPDDFVHQLTLLAPLSPALYNGKPRRLSKSKYVPTTTRKLFLDTHKRFYLVVCELHCDAPGFPTATRDQVCEAGFVVRRRVTPRIDKSAAKEVKVILDKLSSTRLFIQELEVVNPGEQLSIVKKALAPAGEEMLGGAVAESLKKKKGDALVTLAQEKAKFNAWAERYGVSVHLQGWQSLRERVGRWVDVAESPKELTEQVFPLYPLIPDPRDAKHSGRGRNIYFGLVPTSSSDTDDFGNARFDEGTQYEIYCYVRRHRPQCPKKNQKPDCHGDLYWSAPTEPYQLAAHFDLVGTSHSPVTMQLPDLEALQAQAAELPPNKLAPFRMAAPPNSSLQVSADEDGKITSASRTPGIQICSFSIPLITIVATFVFKLFLPVVVLLFGLFFMLKLKFCIPPSIELDAGIKAELDAKMPSFDASFDVSLDASFDVGVAPLGVALDADLNARFDAEMAAGLKSGSPGDPPAIPPTEGLAPAARARMAADIGLSSVAANAPSLTAQLEYEARVEPEVTG